MIRKSDPRPLLLMLACLATAQLHAQSYPQNAYYRTVTETSREIPIGYASTASPQRKIVYSLGPINVRPTRYNSLNYVDVRFQAGLTKRCAGTVRLSYYIVRATRPDSTDGLYVSRFTVVDLPERASGPDNRPLQPDEGIDHSISQSSAYAYPHNAPRVSNSYFNVVMFADSYDRSCIGQTLRLKGDDAHEYHGEFVVKNF